MLDATLYTRLHELAKDSTFHWRSQRDIIRDVMNAANECDTWLTLGELHNLTQYAEASISAQLRHLRKADNGGFAVRKRRRMLLTLWRKDVLYEYRLSSVAAVSAERAEMREEKRVGA